MANGNTVNLPAGFELENQPTLPQGFELETQPIEQQRKPTFIEKLNVPLHAGLGTISGAEKSAASLLTNVTDISKHISESMPVLKRLSQVGVMPQPMLNEVNQKITTKVAELLTKNADYFDKMAAQSGANAVENFVGQVVGGLPAGLLEWETGVPYGAATGAIEAKRQGRSMVWGGIKGGAKRLVLGKMLEALSVIKNPYIRRGGGAATFGGLTAAEGGTPLEIGTQAVMGGTLTGYRGVPTVSPEIAPDARTGVKPTETTPKIEVSEKALAKLTPEERAKVNLTKVPTGKAETLAEQLKGKQEDIIRRPIVQKAVEDGVNVSIDLVKPFAGEDWADKYIVSKKPPTLYEQMAQKEQMETDIPAKLGKLPPTLPELKEYTEHQNKIKERIKGDKSYFQYPGYEGDPKKQVEATILGEKPLTSQFRDDFERLYGKNWENILKNYGIETVVIPDKSTARGYDDVYIFKLENKEQALKDIEWLEKSPKAKNEKQQVEQAIKAGKIFGYSDSDIQKYIEFNHPDFAGQQPPKEPPKPPAPPKPPTTPPISPKDKPILPQPARGWIRRGAEKIYQSIVNRFASIENLTKRAQKLGMTIKPGENPTLRARGYLGMGRKAESVLQDKTYRITKEGQIQITGEGLRPIIDSFEKTSLWRTFPGGGMAKTNASIIDLKDYLIARRTIEDLQRPKYEGSPEEIATPKQVAESQKKMTQLQERYGDNFGIFDQTAKRIYDFQKRVLHTLVEGGNLSEQQYQGILGRNPNYVPFDRIMDDIEGVTGAPRATKPFTGARAPIKKIKGSEREIHDPIESIIKNTYRILDASERNTVARTIINLQRAFPEEIKPVSIKMRPIKVDPKEISTIVKTIRSKTASVIEDIRTTKKTAGGVDIPVGGSIEKVKAIVTEALIKRGMTEGEAGNYIRTIENRAKGGKPTTGENVETVIRQIVNATQRTIIHEEPVESTIFRPSPFKPTGNIVEYFINGKRKYAEVSPNLYESMAGLNETSSSLLVNILSRPASWLRIGATMTPEFMIRNPIRDQQSALMQTSFGIRPFLDSAASIADIVKRTDIYYDWLRSGGAYSGFVELSRPQLKLAYKEMMRQKSLLSRLNIITDAEDISQLGEQATRLAVYEAATQKGLTPIEAGFASREATVDFGRRGSRTKDVNKLVAFFNAGIQGVDKTTRTFGTHPFSTTAKGIAFITIPSLLLYIRNRNDPDYKEIPRWQKDLFYITKVPGTNTYARIPKDFLYGQIFSSIPERFFEYLDSKDRSAFDGLTKSTLDAVLPTAGDSASGLLATAIKPIIENMTNYSFFKQQPILSESIEQLEPSEQYTRYTSETAKEVGKILGYSPAKIENLMQGYIGGMAGYVTGVGDFLINQIRKESGIRIPEKPSDITRRPVLYGITLKSPTETGQAESINKFYKNRDELVGAKETFNKMVKQGRTEEAKKLRKENPKLVLSSKFTSISSQISELNKRIDLIMVSKILTGEQKSEKIAQIEKRRISLAQGANRLLK